MSRTDRTDSPAAMWGAMLRHYREQAGLSQAKLAETINFSDAQVASVETGRRTPSEDFADRCDQATNAHGALVKLHQMLLRRTGFMPGFEKWPEYERRGHDAARVGVDAGTRAAANPGVHRGGPGRKQDRHRSTPISAGSSCRKNPPEIRFVIDEWVLRHCVGGTETMNRQLTHLEQVVCDGLAHIQVKDSDVLPGTSGAFGLATVDGRTVGYEESTTQAWFVTDDQDVHRLEVVYYKLLAEADTPARSLERIRKIREELWKN